MLNRWLTWFNYGLGGAILVMGLLTGVMWFKQSINIEQGITVAKTQRLPKSAFELPAEAYEHMGENLLALQQEPPALQVPDLRQQLIYYGKNGRPDAQASHTLLHFSLNGSKTVVSVKPGEKLYLIYDRKTTPGRYGFSPNNEKTSLWVEASSIDNEALVQVAFENEKGERIREPESLAQFRLPEKEFIRYAGTTWELGTTRVDGTLLARQRARWFGADRFLERHGGEEYKDIADKQRIDFGENEELYFVFVKSNDCLIWDQNRWKAVTPGEASRQHPLLVVKKVDERLMTFELWDVEGKGKMVLNLLKSTEPWIAQQSQTLQHLFKFVGARTKTQCVFEINHERMVLSPSDWLLLTPKGWKKLVTEEEIDNYVNRKTAGTLFVFEGLSRKEERQIMKGSLYSPTRHDFQLIELALQPGGNTKPLAAKEKETENATGTEKIAPNMRGENEITHPHMPGAPGIMHSKDQQQPPHP